ncbi:hypothetical protein ACWC0A_38560 [Streptomyces scopuliridis]
MNEIARRDAQPPAENDLERFEDMLLDQLDDAVAVGIGDQLPPRVDIEDPGHRPGFAWRSDSVAWNR